MLSQTQERLLRWLGRFPRDLVSAWDVPRDISLPGLSEAMGVVRSALHAPLKAMVEQGFLESRLAHVIGGGARRRNVYHLSAKGWQHLGDLPEEENPASAAAKRGTFTGTFPPLVPIIGRATEINQIIEAINTDNNAVVTGLPGIGKTSLARAAAEELSDAGRNIAWTKCTQFDDLSALLSGAFDGAEPPADITAAQAWLRRKIGRGVLIIDELQEVHERHQASVFSFLDEIISAEMAIIIVCRAPSPIEAKNSFAIGELDSNSALAMLGDDLPEESRQKIIDVLGGYPLALMLHDSESDIPTIGDDISQFIEKTVMDSLPEECVFGLDELAAQPIPVGVERLQHGETVGILDDHALLRWSDLDSSSVELQHLVRQVRRAMWDEETTRRVHTQAAERWAEHPESQARFIELHHRLEAEDDDVATFLEFHSDELGRCDDGALAALLHDGIEKMPEVAALWQLAAKTALDRAETEVASELLSNMPDSDAAPALSLRARLELQLGNGQIADQLFEQSEASALPAEKVRIVIANLTRALDDRLPLGLPAIGLSEIINALKELTLDELTPEKKQRTLVAIASIRHIIAILENDYSAAKKIRLGLSGLASEDDPLLKEMELRATLAQSEYDTEDWHRESEHLRRFIDETSGIRAVSLRLALVEKLFQHQPEAAAELIDECDVDMPVGPTARRLTAKLWYWRGALNSSRGLECWREAIHQWRSAECVHAAQELTQKMHEMLR
ncbi:MAG: AAA family ATPase [Candidatus Poseidoniaceae archaeon]|nr:AAA family ATPase [Candidatus Poseidoniaceae archaeon]